MRFLLLIALLFPLCLPANDSTTVVPQTVELRQFDQIKIEEFQADDDFNYTERNELDSWWEELKRAISEWWERMQDNEATGFFFQHLDWILIGMMLVFLFLYLRTRALRGIFYKNVGGNSIRPLHDGVHINEVDLEALLRHAETEKEFRSAVRYHYLMLLKDLHQKELIDWRADKTDRQYSREIKDEGVRASFEDLSFVFKYVWYGELDLDGERYQKMAAAFQSYFSKAKRA